MGLFSRRNKELSPVPSLAEKTPVALDVKIFAPDGSVLQTPGQPLDSDAAILQMLSEEYGRGVGVRLALKIAQVRGYLAPEQAQELIQSGQRVALTRLVREVVDAVAPYQEPGGLRALVEGYRAGRDVARVRKLAKAKIRGGSF